ncbi:MAG: hypothetical protein JHC93_03610 [Parachlamydiales bacterium]|nr:hypothetical protein [Parachlamydiales bacterium]
MKINEKVFCFPPYISTTWDHIRSLQVETDPISRTDLLVVTLADNVKVKIPHLDQKILQAIFAAHLKFIENGAEEKIVSQGSQSTGIPFKLGIGNLENLGAALQHNPEQKDMPDMPADMLEKITSIAKIVGPEEAMNMPKPEYGCNCLHCQIAKAIHNTLPQDEIASNEEDEVTEEDLRFKVWDIMQNGEKLYTVTNPLDAQEQYNVYLGDPVGCTCGDKNCEHIHAVLKS